MRRHGSREIGAALAMLWTACQACGLETAGERPTDAGDSSRNDGSDGEVQPDDRVDDRRDVADVPGESAGVCGNGTLEGTEECDDGAGNSNTTPDACRTDCRRAQCGDAVVDSGEACDGGEPVACTTTCGTPGTGACTASCTLPTGSACRGPDEVCNGMDDDCNGSTDETFDCTGTETGSCTNACGTTGSRTCTAASCTWGACCGAVEVCPTSCAGPTCDDDCDGDTDEDCAPCNDDCANAAPLTASGDYPGSTALATSDHSGGCNAGVSPDVWFTFTLASSELVYLDTRDGLTWDSTIALYSGACPGEFVDCSDDTTCPPSSNRYSTIVRLLPAGTYRVVVDGYNGASGAFTLTYQHIPVPGGATQVLGNGDYDAHTTGEGNDHTGSCGGGAAPDIDYWVFRCTPRTGVDVHTCHGTGETDIDTVLYWLGPDGVELACNDDDPGCGTVGRSGIADTTLPTGISVLVVDGYDTAAGIVRTTFGGM
jgi:hypothetical protein